MTRRSQDQEDLVLLGQAEGREGGGGARTRTERGRLSDICYSKIRGFSTFVHGDRQSRHKAEVFWSNFHLKIVNRNSRFEVFWREHIYEFMSQFIVRLHLRLQLLITFIIDSYANYSPDFVLQNNQNAVRNVGWNFLDLKMTFCPLDIDI